MERKLVNLTGRDHDGNTVNGIILYANEEVIKLDSSYDTNTREKIAVILTRPDMPREQQRLVWVEDALLLPIGDLATALSLARDPACPNRYTRMSAAAGIDGE